MQEHLDNYQEINAKLRSQITELENALKQKPVQRPSSSKKPPLAELENVCLRASNTKTD